VALLALGLQAIEDLLLVRAGRDVEERERRRGRSGALGLAASASRARRSVAPMYAVVRTRTPPRPRARRALSGASTLTIPLHLRNEQRRSTESAEASSRTISDPRRRSWRPLTRRSLRESGMVGAIGGSVEASVPDVVSSTATRRCAGD
jgi:hypothetical protein